MSFSMKPNLFLHHDTKQLKTSTHLVYRDYFVLHKIDCNDGCGIVIKCIVENMSKKTKVSQLFHCIRHLKRYNFKLLLDLYSYH